MPPVTGMRATLRGTSEFLLGKYIKAGGPVHVLTDEQRAAWKAKVEPNWPAFVSSLGKGAEAMWPKVIEAQAACKD